MVNAGASIEAFLKLDASGFITGVESSKSAVTQFKKEITQMDSEFSKKTKAITEFTKALRSIGEESHTMTEGVQSISKALSILIPKLSAFANVTKEANTFKTFASGLKSIAEAAQRMGSDLARDGAGIQALTEVMKIWETGVRSAELSVNLTANAIRNLANVQQQEVAVEKQVDASYKQTTQDLALYHQNLKALALGVEQFNAIQNSSQYTVQRLTTSINMEKASLIDLWNVYERGNMIIRTLNQTSQALSSELERRNVINQSLITGENKFFASIEEVNVALEKNSQEMLKNAEAKLRAMGYTGELDTVEKKLAVDTNQTTSSIQRQSTAYNQASSNANRLTTATNGLTKAFQSLKMIGTLVASMMVWNFASSLINATRETVNAKSEMEGYFQMLHFSQGEIADFNNALDQTVSRFQRINKYSLGETISSIGVEFNLTTEEMKKAMPVVSMITSEYLRAGRNVNEASLAVKDILQGEFQRLSRETGVKGAQLKEAGWSGDKTDVMGLLEALDKVGKSRNWDVFVTKANSLNDAVLILQNRFGEWSAEMVNAVQPAILNVFNSIMNFAEGLSQAIGNLWQWFTGGSWGAIVTQVGLLSGAILVASQGLVMYRSGMGLAQASQLGLTKSIASVVLGLKGQEIAEIGVGNAIKSKILGVNAEVIAEKGVIGAIREKTAMTKLEAFEEKINTTVTQENATAKKILALQEKINKAESEGLIATETAKTLKTKLDTVETEINTVAKTENAMVTGGLTGAIISLTTAEVQSAVATGQMSVAMGVLNGLFYASPIGWFALAVLGLASAFYVLTGGLSDSWDKMKTFNETVQQGNEALKPYHDRLTSLKTQLDEAKAKYGENSEEVKNLQSKVDDAQTSFDSFRESLQKATKVSGELKDELGQLEPKMDAITRKNYGSFGHTNEESDELSKQMSALGYGTDQYYVALQKLVAMEGNFSDAQRDAIPIMTDHGRGALENAQNLGEWNKAYEEYIKHSTNANISEDWWTWLWESIYAGTSKSQADFILVREAIETKFRDLFSSFKSGLLEGKYFKGDIDKQIAEWFDGLGDSYNQWADGFSKWAKDGIQKAQEDLVKAIDDFFSFKWLNGMFVSASDGSSDHPSFMEDLSNILGFDVQTWIDNFTSDPLGTLGVQPIDIASILFAPLFGLYEGATTIATFVDTSIIQPLKNGISQGIASIPILSDIASMLGLVPQQNQNAHDTGYNLIDQLKQGVEQKISEIPIVGDIARMLGLIPSQNSNARDKGHGVGDNIKQGEADGHKGMADNVKTELGYIIEAMTNKAKNIYSKAFEIGGQIKKGVEDALDMHSPSILSRELIPNEFGVYIPNAIIGAVDTVYETAKSYGQAIKDGISSVNNDFSMDGMADEYKDDAQIVAQYSQMMGLDTTTAFNDMALAVNTTTTQMQGNVSTSYSAMQTKQATLLNNMKQSNLTAYQQMTNQSNQSLIQMRDSTSNITVQMTNAWHHMKDSIVATANNLRSETTVHFDSLSQNIGSFYRKIQNPSNWGAGSPTMQTRGARNSRVGKAFVSSISGRYAGGGSNSRYSPYTSSSATMSLGRLKQMICPNGDCGIFDGYDLSQVVNVADFLGMLNMDGGFGWTGWNSTHYQHIRTRSNEWQMKSPILNVVGGIPTNANFKVGEFENSTPKISFGSFQSMAQSLFSAVPYAFYYNSDKYGSWQNALAHGECNCWDGANALIAFARTCGFDGYIAHGSWDGIPHVWAVINGVKMDTTGMQQRGTWTPSASAGSPPNGVGNTYGDVNITIHIYDDGVDVDENKVDSTTAKAIMDLVGVNMATGV